VPEPDVTVTIQEIHRIAALARLRLEPGEAERMAGDMSSILEHMAVLGGVALEPSPASAVPRTGDSAPPGGDDSAETDPSAEPDRTVPDPLELPLSRMAPDWRDGLFVVPRLPGVAGASDERDDSP
jgi:hypothetical protein